MAVPHVFPLEPTPTRVSDQRSCTSSLRATSPPADERVRAFENGPQAEWFNHVNVNAHDHGGHFIP